MNLRVDITPETEKRLRERAAEHGLSPEGFVQGILEHTLANENMPSPGLPAARKNGERNSAERSEDSGEQDDSAAPWRGVFALEYQHPTLFDKTITVKDLPKWEPQVIINPRWLADDDE